MGEQVLLREAGPICHLDLLRDRKIHLPVNLLEPPICEGKSTNYERWKTPSTSALTQSISINTAKNLSPSYLTQNDPFFKFSFSCFLSMCPLLFPLLILLFQFCSILFFFPTTLDPFCFVFFLFLLFLFFREESPPTLLSTSSLGPSLLTLPLIFF